MHRILTAVLFLPLAWGADAQPEVEWIRTHAVPLKTAEARHGFADMQPLKKIVGDARIVALGEATHGTREFFQLKHRMLEFLATEMGFTVFSIEANMPDAYRLNDYVLHGKGDPKRLVKGMGFWTWDTEEVLDMVLWMREFNKSGKGRVEFTGFDMQNPAAALESVRGFVAKFDAGYAAELRRAAAMTTPSSAGAGENFGVATASFPVKNAAGKRVRFSGYIKTEGVADGFAGLWWRVDGPSGMLAFDNMQDRGAKGTTDWKRFDIELPVAPGAKNINFGALLTGSGTAWFDGLSVELDGAPYVDPDAFDFDFESSSPKGFFTAGQGYQVQLDSEVFHSGKQSLRMRRLGVPTGADPKLAAAAWKDVVRHLESSREVYTKNGATSSEIDWAIQDARLVRQAMQMRSNEIPRDVSMAENVKWILDRSPHAKIVLWAHNAHVSAASAGGYEPMGAALRKTYGKQMVVFGFAFNQGSFQAMGAGRLRDFTAPPAPKGSFDATLAAAGIPLFALDLRQASGPAAAWLNEPHKTRNVGAMYSESTASAYYSEQIAPQRFDAILFVEKTTAARKNQDLAFVAQPADASGAREFRDPESGISFKLPHEWGVDHSLRWGDHETTAWFNAPNSKAVAALYFKILSSPRESLEDARRWLPAAMDAKVVQRVTAGLEDYRIRPKSCQPRNIGGRLALSCIADYAEKARSMSEYLILTGSANAEALFFAQMPAAELDAFRAQFDPIVETLRLP